MDREHGEGRKGTSYRLLPYNFLMSKSWKCITYTKNFKTWGIDPVSRQIIYAKCMLWVLVSDFH